MIDIPYPGGIQSLWHDWFDWQSEFACIWAQFLKDLGVLNSMYPGGLAMSSIASLAPCQNHRWWQGLRWQWFHRLCYLVCIWVGKLVALSGCAICPFWHLQLRRVDIASYIRTFITFHGPFGRVVHSMYTPTRCKLLSQKPGELSPRHQLNMTCVENSRLQQA